LDFNPLSPEFNPYQNLMAVGRSFYPAVNYLANFFRGGRQPTSATIPANLAHPMQATGGAEWNPVMRGQSPGLQMIPNFNTQTPITMPNMTGRPRPPVSINQLTQPPSRFSYFPSVMQSL
jgi:hypothetical protein